MSTGLERIQRACGIACVALFLCTIGIGAAIGADDKDPLTAGGLILTIVFLTAYMIASAINQRRRWEMLAKILSEAAAGQKGGEDKPADDPSQGPPRG